MRVSSGAPTSPGARALFHGGIASAVAQALVLGLVLAVWALGVAGVDSPHAHFAIICAVTLAMVVAGVGVKQLSQ